MADTLKEIISQHEQLETEVKAIGAIIDNAIIDSPELLSIDTVSQVAPHRQWRNVVSFLLFLCKQSWKQDLVELQEIKDSAFTCNDIWFNEEIRKFQYGDVLLFNNATKRYYYGAVDQAKQLVKFVAIVNGRGGGKIKVAGSDNLGNPVKLADDVFISLVAYVKKIQPTGANIELFTGDPDELRLPLTITYDPLIPLSQIIPAVESAKMRYLKGLDFNGMFYLIKLQDEIQKVPGVIDVVPGQLEARVGGGAWITFQRNFSPVAGYAVLETGKSAADFLTYQAS